MYAEHVERVVCTEHFLQPIDTPEAGETSDQADDQTTTDADVARCWRDRHQASHSTRCSTQHGSLAAHQRFTHTPSQYSRSSSTQGVDESQCREAVGFQRRAGIETKPANPQQCSTNHGQGQAVRSHGFLAVANTLADHEGSDQASNSGVDMHNGTAGKIKCAHLPDITAFGIHGVNHFLAGVDIRAHPEPHHVCNRCVAEGEPQRHEEQHSRELDAFCKRANDQAAGDASKRSLECRKHDFRNHNAFAKRSGIFKRAFHVVPDSTHEQPAKPAEERIAFGKRQAVAVDKPQHNNHRESDHDLHQHGQHVLAADQAAVEQCQTGNGHEDHQQGGDHHPGGIALIWHGRGCSSGSRCSGRSCSHGWCCGWGSHCGGRCGFGRLGRCGGRSGSCGGHCRRLRHHGRAGGQQAQSQRQGSE